MPPPGRVYMSVKHAAELLQVPERTVRRWIRRGELEEFRFGRRPLIRVARAEVESLLDRVAHARRVWSRRPGEDVPLLDGPACGCCWSGDRQQTTVARGRDADRKSIV